MALGHIMGVMHRQRESNVTDVHGGYGPGCCREYPNIAAMPRLRPLRIIDPVDEKHRGLVLHGMDD